MRTYFLLWISLLLFVSASAQPKASQEVLQAQQQRFEAMIAQDWDILDELLAADMLYTHSNAQTDNKYQLLSTLKSKKTVYQSIQPSGVRVRVYGTTGIINGKAAVNVLQEGKEQTINLCFTDVYAKRNGRWQFVNWQSTRLPE